MLGRALIFAVFGVICYYISEYRAWIDFDRVLYSKSPGKCRTILENGGSEDLADLDEETVLFSSGLSFSGSAGKIYALYMNGTLEEAKVMNTIDNKNHLSGPHGISIWKDPKTGQILLYVVIHEPTAEGVVVFEVMRQPLTLRYIKTIRDDAFSGFMNDLVVLDRDKFYITQSVRNRNMMLIALELGLSLPTGKLVYYDGKGSKTVKSYMVMANGVALSRDKRTLYVSEFGMKRVHAFLIKDNGNIDTDWVADIGSGPDNIQVDPETGDLWIGAFPLLYRTLDVLNIFGAHQDVAQILRVQMSNERVAGIEEVFFNNGSTVTAASTALYKNKKLIIGTVTSQAWLDIDRVIYSKSPGPCKTLLAGGGSEDFADLDEDTILVSSGVNTFGLPGKIYGLYTNGTLVEAKVVNKVNGESPLLGAHGLSVWKDPITGTSWLYVVIHGLTEDGVAVFEVDKNPLTLKYIKTIKDLAFSGFMNDLVVVAKDTFYITKFIHLRSLVGFVLELGLCLPTGKLIYFDGTSAKTVKSGFVLANGIAISKDKRTLYVSDTGQKRVHVLNIQSNGDVETASVIDIGTSPDNLVVDPVSGDLWIGACPKLITALNVNGIFGNHPPVAQVLRVRLVNKNMVDTEEVYSNNGSVVSGSSVALYKNKKLFIGTISSQLVMCDVNYLQDW